MLSLSTGLKITITWGAVTYMLEYVVLVYWAKDNNNMGAVTYLLEYVVLVYWVKDNNNMGCCDVHARICCPCLLG